MVGILDNLKSPSLQTGGIDSMRIYATTSATPNGDRVLPFQGVDDLFGMSSQGDALGYRVLAPLARKTNKYWIGYQISSPKGMEFTNPGRCDGKMINIAMSPDGAKFASPGQRPGNTTNKSPSPAGAQSVSPGRRPGPDS
jgi:hypothetical protein